MQGVTASPSWVCLLKGVSTLHDTKGELLGFYPVWLWLWLWDLL